MRTLTGTTTLLFLLAACAESPSGLPTEDSALFAAKGGPPSSCNAYAPLSATVTGAGLTSDGGGAYVEGVDGVESHINGPTGNLSIWTTESPRYLVANPSGGPVNIDRAYTNNHSNTCGLQLSTLPASSTAVFEAEERADGGSGSTVSKVVYGKTCSGAADADSRVSIGYSSGIITITGTSGRYCLLTGKGKNPWSDGGAVGGFSMVLTPQ